MRTVVFDGVEIPETLLAREVQNHPGASAAEARAAAGHALAIRALLLDRARMLGLTPASECDAQGREETPDEALVRAVLDEEVVVPRPSEAERRRVYDAERSRFRAPTLYEASHILIEPKGGDEAALRAAHALACALIDQLANGVRDFADLAREVSDCSSAAFGGALGQLKAGDLVPEVEEVLMALSPGEVAPAPAPSRFGFHVLRLDRRIEGKELPFEMVDDKIAMHLESRAWTAAAARYVGELAAAARTRGVALSLTDEGAIRSGSLTLGDFLGDAAAADRLAPWLAAAEPALADRLSAAAEAAGEPVADFARHAMADFVAEANDERWTNLISTARDAADPALACLAAVLRSKLVPAKQTFTLIRRASA